MAVVGEHAAAETADGPSGLARLRDRLGDLPAASPWLPRQLWKRAIIGFVYGLALASAGLLLVQPFTWVGPLEPAAGHLLSGPRPPLLVYVTTALWFAAGQFAALIGWYRSHSENDFHGRYRVWAMLSGAFAGASFLAATGVHVPLFTAAVPYWRSPIWRPEVLSWLAPLTVVGLLLWWRMDRDVRRCHAGLWLLRLAAVIMLASAGGHLFTPELSREAWYPTAMTLSLIVGPGLLVLGLWLQACHVAYVCADPPEPVAITWFGRLIRFLTRLPARIWPFGRKADAPGEDEGRPTRRRKKADEDDAEASPKRRRKPAAKSRRTTKPRTRTKESEPEDETDDTWGSEEESFDEGASDATDDDSGGWSNEAQEAMPSAAAGPNRAAPTSSPGTTIMDDSSDTDNDDYRMDGPHENADMFKGLSKRQRRELKKQLRDQQRNR